MVDEYALWFEVVVGGDTRWWIAFIGCCMRLFEEEKKEQEKCGDLVYYSDCSRFTVFSGLSGV
jgi:hypothetical protein